jgi:hypothetical protein
MTGAAINASVNTLKGIKFGRVEDLDYKKVQMLEQRNILMLQDKTGNNADASRTKYGRVYKLNLDANNPLVGTLEVILMEMTVPELQEIQNPDNICVTKTTFMFRKMPMDMVMKHDAYIYQYNMATN